jgi:membrane protein
MDLHGSRNERGESRGNPENTRSEKTIPAPVYSFSRSHDRSHTRPLLGWSPRHAVSPAADVATGAVAAEPARPSEALGDLAVGPADLVVGLADPDRPVRQGHTTWWESLGGFWTKIMNDWIFNLAGLLAFNVLMALFPILLLVLAGCGLVLRAISRVAEAQLEHRLAAALPGTTGTILVSSVAAHLQQSAGLLLVLGLLTAFLAGSRLFITLENCFGIVFRLRGRDPVHQNRMAFGMLLLSLLLVPAMFLVSLVPAGLIGLVDPHGRSPIAGALGVLAEGAHLLLSFAGALLLFGLLYGLVPNRPRRWRTWRCNGKGTVVAAALLLLYEGVFRLYQQHILHAENYGTIAGFALVLLLFLYYLALIILLGAELNSWTAGQRETAADLSGILHAIQAHHTLRGAAGPTAGLPHEEMQHHRRSRVYRYLEAVLRRTRTGHPFAFTLPRHRKGSQGRGRPGLPGPPGPAAAGERNG